MRVVCGQMDWSTMSGRRVALCLVAVALIACRSSRQPPSGASNGGAGRGPDPEVIEEMPPVVPSADARGAMDVGPNEVPSGASNDARSSGVDASGSGDAPPPTTKTDAGVAPGSPPDAGLEPSSGGDRQIPTVCGNERADVSAVREPDGLAIDSDGTLYYTHIRDGWETLGRVRPGVGRHEPEFLRVVRGTTPWGLAIDSGRRRLYFASSTASTIYVIDLTQAQPSAQILLSVPGILPNDLAIGPNGDVYFSDHADNHLYRVDLTGVRSQVTTTPLGLDGDRERGNRPSALAFGPTGELFVGTRGWGNIHRITLVAGSESARQLFGAFVGWANGLAFDQQGRLYVSLYDNERLTDVVRLDPGGTREEVLAMGGRFSSLAFGRGALSCNDVYVSERTGAIRRITVDVPGLAKP
jgi:sugar lactone lactonase YvrE